MRSDEKGQSMVETALILPLLLLIMAGIFDFGRMLYSYSHLHMAAQETVRVGGLGEGDASMIQFARNYIDLPDADQVAVTITPTQSSRTHGDYVTVKLSYPFEFATPLISTIFPAPFQVKTESTIRVE